MRRIWKINYLKKPARICEKDLRRYHFRPFPVPFLCFFKFFFSSSPVPYKMFISLQVQVLASFCFLSRFSSIHQVIIFYQFHPAVSFKDPSTNLFQAHGPWQHSSYNSQRFSFHQFSWFSPSFLAVYPTFSVHSLPLEFVGVKIASPKLTLILLTIKNAKCSPLRFMILPNVKAAGVKILR